MTNKFLGKKSIYDYQGVISEKFQKVSATSKYPIQQSF